MSLSNYSKPFRVEVNPFGKKEGDEDNIFIVDKEGTTMIIISKHPVWTYLSKARLTLAEEVVKILNDNSS